MVQDTEDEEEEEEDEEEGRGEENARPTAPTTSSTSTVSSPARADDAGEDPLAIQRADVEDTGDTDTRPPPVHVDGDAAEQVNVNVIILFASAILCFIL